MGLLQRVKDLILPQKETILPMTETQYKDYLMNSVMTLESVFEKSGLLKKQPLNNPAQNSYLMFKCVQVLADRIPTIPLKLYKYKTDEEDRKRVV